MEGKTIFSRRLQTVRNRHCWVFGNWQRSVIWNNLMAWPDWPWPPHFTTYLHHCPLACTLWVCRGCGKMPPRLKKRFTKKLDGVGRRHDVRGKVKARSTSRTPSLVNSSQRLHANHCVNFAVQNIGNHKLLTTQTFSFPISPWVNYVHWYCQRRDSSMSRWFSPRGKKELFSRSWSRRIQSMWEAIGRRH